jgi:DNA-binding transcriptional LysR family regulator
MRIMPARGQEDRMELRRLEQFVAVAEERSFTRAARRVHIVQSGLSASIRALESELGAPLFSRNTRRVDLTAAGKVFLQEARHVLEAARAARDAVAGVQRLLRGTLAIGMSQSLSAFMDLPALLGRFHGAHPGVDIRLRQAAASQLARELTDGRLDLALLALAEAPPPGLRTRTLFREPMVVIFAPDHPFASRRKRPREAFSIDALAEETFVEFQGDWGTRRLVDRAFAEQGLDRRIACEVNDHGLLLDLVRQGLGIALVPRSLAAMRPLDGQSASLTWAPLDDPAPVWEMAVATAAPSNGNGGGPMNAAAAAFLALVDQSPAEGRS